MDTFCSQQARGQARRQYCSIPGGKTLLFRRLGVHRSAVPKEFSVQHQRAAALVCYCTPLDG
eukprot:12898109-Prorocentrum_lima.AAC.1